MNRKDVIIMTAKHGDIAFTCLDDPGAPLWNILEISNGYPLVFRYGVLYIHVHGFKAQAIFFNGVNSTTSTPLARAAQGSICEVCCDVLKRSASNFRPASSSTTLSLI